MTDQPDCYCGTPSGCDVHCLVCKKEFGSESQFDHYMRKHPEKMTSRKDVPRWAGQMQKEPKPLPETHPTLWVAMQIERFVKLPEAGWIIPEDMVQKHTIDVAEHERLLESKYNYGFGAGMFHGEDKMKRRVREAIEKLSTSKVHRAVFASLSYQLGIDEDKSR